MFETGFTAIYEHCKREVEEIKGENMQGYCSDVRCYEQLEDGIQDVRICDNCGDKFCFEHSIYHPGSFAVPECVQCDECRNA